MKTEKRALGDIGENVACAYLQKHGFEIVKRNYLRKWGELDIVARKSNVIHFVEVKSVSLGHSSSTGEARVPQVRAEENMHPGKIKRLGRIIQTYLLEKRLDMDWQLDLALVKIDESSRKATVELIQNIF